MKIVVIFISYNFHDKCSLFALPAGQKSSMHNCNVLEN